MNRAWISIVLYLGMLPFMSVVAGAQTGPVGTLSGTVTDVSGAAVAHAKITATNTSTGRKSIANTDSKGLYRLQDLSPGRYDLRVDAVGLRPQIVRGVEVQSSGGANVKSTLELGAVSESIEVVETKTLPFTLDEVLHFLQARVPLRALQTLVNDAGIDFQCDSETVAKLRKTGADKDLLLALVKRHPAQKSK